MRLSRNMNREGLTWQEWADAAALPLIGAHACYGHHEPKLYSEEYKAWLECEDPTEWRAAA